MIVSLAVKTGYTLSITTKEMGILAQIVERKKRSPDGRATWLVRIYEGLDENGKRKYISYNVTGTQKEAEQAAKKLEVKRDDGNLIDPSRQSLQEWLTEWLDVWARRSVQERTLSDYTRLLQTKVIPVLGNQPLHKLQNDNRAFQRLIDRIEEESGERTAQYVHVILKQAMNRAVSKRLMERNPLQDVPRPKVETKKARALDSDEIQRFLKAARTRWQNTERSPYYPLFVLMIDAGCRPGEALALWWTDFENDMQTMHIERSLEHTKTGWRTKEPKTVGSRRTVALTPATAALLRRHQAAQREWLTAHPDNDRDPKFVFASQNGEPLDKHNLVQRHFKPLLIDAGLPRSIRLYDLRHTCASQLLKANVNPKIVSERLGHASVNMTLNVYSHLLPNMQQIAVDALSKVFPDIL